jgi:hypothetical protein
MPRRFFKEITVSAKVHRILGFGFAAREENRLTFPVAASKLFKMNVILLKVVVL